MNININNKNNSRYLILLFMVSVFSAIVFLASYENLQQSVFANPQDTMKDKMMNTMIRMPNQNMMMDPSQMQAMMQQMNKTAGMMGMGPMMMMGGQQWPMMGIGPMMMMQPMNQTGKMGMGPIMMGPMMGMGQGMTMPCMMMVPMMMGNQTMMGMMPCMTMNPGTMGMGSIMMGPMMMMEPSQMLAMMGQQMNKTGTMMGQMNK